MPARVGYNNQRKKLLSWQSCESEEHHYQISNNQNNDEVHWLFDSSLDPQANSAR